MIHITHSLGGCGGTVLSRCIGVLPGVALLSEINPASVKLFSHFDPLYQDKNWLRLLGPADRGRFSQMDLGNVEALRELVDVFHIRAIEAGRHLVLRDYNFVDFVGVPFTAEPLRSRSFVSSTNMARPGEHRGCKVYLEHASSSSRAGDPAPLSANCVPVAPACYLAKHCDGGTELNIVCIQSRYFLSHSRHQGNQPMVFTERLQDVLNL